MSSYEVEMDDLGNKKQRTSTQAAEIPTPPGAPHDSTEQVWALTVAGVLAVLSLPLLFFPRFLLFLSNATDSALLTPLESFLCAQLGILVLGLAAGVVIASPDIPDISDRDSNPLLAPISIAAAASSLLAWNAKGVGSLGVFMSIGTGVIGAWGFWAMLFSGSSYISKKTGADKRTSTWLFGNKTAARAQKKAWKARQKEM